MMGKCVQCGEEGEMPISINGRKFCNSKCSRENRYRPDMTEETYQAETVIDVIDLDGGKEVLILQTPESFYTLYSKYRVIITRQRMFHNKQLGGFKSLSNAREAWEKLKKKHNVQSWADKRKEKKNLD